MAQQILGNSYGPTVIKGQARVQQGNIYHSGLINIETLVVPLPAGVPLLLQNKRLECSEKSTRRSRRKLQRPRIANKRLNSSKSVAKVIEQQAEVLAKRINQKVATISAQHGNVNLPTLLQMVEKWVYKFATFPNFFSTQDDPSPSPNVRCSGRGKEEFTALAPLHPSQATVIHEHGTAAVAVLLWILGKNVSSTEPMKVVYRCSADILSLTLVFVLCSGIYRYLVLGPICQSQLDRLYLMLESRRTQVIGRQNWDVSPRLIKAGDYIDISLRIYEGGRTYLFCVRAVVAPDFEEVHCFPRNFYH